jgi:group I intron endonuclease
MKLSGIYKIQSIIKPERIYIGSSVDINKRWCEHLKRLRLCKHENKKIQYHFDKYKESDLVFIILEPCLPKFLLIREQYYINVLKPYFNICKIAGSHLGCKRSDESRLNMSIAQIRSGNKPTDECKRMSIEAHTGFTPWNKGIKTGIKPPTIFKKGLVPWNKGTAKTKIKWDGIVTEKTKSKLRLARAGRKPTLGFKHSEETKLKMSKSHAGHIPYTKPILQFDKEMNFIKEWTSGIEIERTIGICNNNVSRAANGYQNSAGGFIWKFKN